MIKTSARVRPSRPWGWKAGAACVSALLLVSSLAAGGCVASPPSGNAGASNAGGANANAGANASPASAPADISTSGAADEDVTPEQVQSGRRDAGWKRYVQAESAEGGRQSSRNAEKVSDISPESVNTGKMSLPLSGEAEGPSVFRAQVLLDRARFSPGVMDGLWGKNTEKAVFWLQKREGLKATGAVDEQTFKRMFELAGRPDKFVTEHTLSEQEVSGPFVKIPSDTYERAKLDCMCYESLEEKLAETFHTTPDLLKKLNPQADLNSLKAGDRVNAPNLRQAGDGDASAGVEKIVISDGGHYLHALDSGGRILYHFPSTLGSSYAPSPSGDYKITAIARDPTWHYQPKLLTGVDDSKEDAIIPAGPNNPVGKVWMQLSKPHYGVHGTKAPETIGYATSHGCVRLTNWDAVFLSERIKPGVPVQFTDTEGDS